MARKKIIEKFLPVWRACLVEIPSSTYQVAPKIPLIKAVRVQHGLGLKEAKELCEQAIEAGLVVPCIDNVWKWAARERPIGAGRTDIETSMAKDRVTARKLKMLEDDNASKTRELSGLRKNIDGKNEHIDCLEKDNRDKYEELRVLRKQADQDQAPINQLRSENHSYYKKSVAVDDKEKRIDRENELLQDTVRDKEEIIRLLERIHDSNC